MKSLRLVCTAFVAGVAGCSLPMIGSNSSVATPTVHAMATDITIAAPPVVQVRGYWRSSVVSVVAWDVDDADFGLRTSVTRTGKLVGGLRSGDHSLYLTPFLVRSMGGFAHAAIMPEELLLLGTGRRSDPYSCFYGKNCSPMVTVGVRVPDSLLRANRDSLVVTFFPRAMDPWTITLRRELIDAYLQKVDSVVAEMKKTGTT
jgi:hypothetical protein